MEWDWEFIAPLTLGMTAILSLAGVLIFRPLTKRLGDLIEITARNRKGVSDPDSLARLTGLVDHLAEKIERLEERQDFTERVLTSVSGGERARLRGPGGEE